MTLCEGPFWQHDDLSQCFQTVYLQIAFPIIICVCSCLLILLQAVFFAKTNDGEPSTRIGFSDLDGSYGPQSSSTDGAGRIAKDDFGPGDIDRSKWLWLFRSCNFGIIPTKKISRFRRSKIAETSIEVCCLLGELVIHVVTIFTGVVEPSSGGPHTFSQILSTIPWLYIASLAVLSISNQTRVEGNFSLDVELSYHKVTLFCLQGIFTAARFRSTAIHPPSTITRIATSLDFALNVVLIVNTLSASNRGFIVDGPSSSLTSSGEMSSSIISKATFTWVDPLIWRRDTRDHEISTLWDLLPKDKALSILMGFQIQGQVSKLMWKLIRDSRSVFLVQGIWAAVSGLSTFLPTLLLKAILQYVEDPADNSSSNGWLFVMLLFIAGCVKSVADGQASWMGRKIYVRLRVIIVGELYSKLLTRRASALCTYELPEDQGQSSSTNTLKVQHHSVGQGNSSSPGSGQIMTLMAVDSVKVGDLGASLHVLMIKAPLEFLLGIILLYRILGYSSIAALCVLGLLTPLRIGFARGFRQIQVDVMTATDARVQFTNDVLQNIRLIKYFAWECRFIDKIDQARHIELQCLRRRFLLIMLASSIQSAAPVLMAVLSFFSYTLLEEKTLIPSVAFASLSLFSLLRGPLDQLSDTLAKVQESTVSIKRVEKFLCQKSTGISSQHVSSLDSVEEEYNIGFHNATLSWGDIWDSDSFRLAEINVQFQANSLNTIIGPTGSGKSSLLLALLGEMTLLSGSLYLPRSNKSELPILAMDSPPRVAYCSQQAWLRNDCIKNNIVFGNPWNYDKYECILETCCLVQDLCSLPLGDSTMVGEKGVKLSGGQKQRIALARAVYSGASTVLLDDCLSAVDSHTCQLIFDRCIRGPLMHRRTCILVTNNVALCVPQSELVVAMQGGRVYKQGRPNEVFPSCAPGANYGVNPSSSTLASLDGSFTTSDSKTSKLSSTRESQAAHSSAKGTGNDARGSNDFAETKPEGSVRASLVQLYLSSMGAWYYWLGLLMLFFANQLGTVAKDVWVRKWANQHSASLDRHLHQEQVHTPERGFEQQGIQFKTQINTYSRFSSFPLTPRVATARYDAFYLEIFALLGLVSVGLRFTRIGIQYTGSLSASKRLHHRLLVRILRARFAFFDVTPLGRILNRFSKDIEVIDQGVAHVIFGFQNAFFSVVTIWIVISAVTPTFLPFSFLIFLIYFCIGKLYIKSSRSLKRLEAVQRSPLYQHFDETLTGITTIRAYDAESRFMRQNLDTLDAHTRPWLYLWATNNWLTFRVEFVSACINFIVGALIVWNVKKVDPGAAGLALTYAVSFTDNVLWLVRLYASTEIHMNCVERVEEYIDTPQEAATEVSENRPPGDWLRYGSIEFINYTTKYKDDLPPVLKNLTFKVNAGEKIGIVGRTGAGKSSLALSIFRGLESVEGQILIDGLDIKDIGLNPLRKAMTVVPQDTGLFTGTIRTNLDPFEQFTDEELYAALRRVKLINSPTQSDHSGLTSVNSGTVLSSPNSEAATNSIHENRNLFHDLSSPVLDSGANIAQGHRQLLCLARALLRDTKILIMDEATASLDHETDTKLHGTIAGLSCTVLTIAHRLRTVIEYDRVLVLEHGEVVKYDEPWALVRDDDGVFRAMCEASEDFELLQSLARERWEAKRLVDDTLP